MVIILTQIKYLLGHNLSSILLKLYNYEEINNIPNYTSYTNVFLRLLLHENYKLRQVYENIEEIKEYVNEDIFNGNMDPDIGEIYLDLLNDSENKLEDVINNK